MKKTNKSIDPLPRLSWSTKPDGGVHLIIMDGIALAPDQPGNAVAAARTPCLDQLMSGHWPWTKLCAHGPAVGMPSWNDMGNSEVGHNTIGAGRVYDQGATRVQQAIASGELFKGQVWRTLVDPLIQSPNESGQYQAALHCIGLLSDGNVHSHIDHLFALLERATRDGVRRLYVHALLDGRDVRPRSALEYVQQTETKLAELKEKFSIEAAIASGGGRMQITMDRYNADWLMVERGWKAHVLGEAETTAVSAAEAIQRYYDASTGSDQDMPGFVVVDQQGKSLAPIEDGDSVIFFNFRGDRAIELSQAFQKPDGGFPHFDRRRIPAVQYAGMMLYDGDTQTPEHFLVEPPTIENPLSAYLCHEGLHSFAISETQKYGHVTYFWNGNRSGYIDQELETYIEIPSDRRPFDQQPSMRAVEITEKTCELIESGQYDVGRLNLANGDMVGHTGSFEAAVRAVEAVDQAVATLVEFIVARQGVALVTADHGNADEMFIEHNGERQVKTAHTLNPVPFIIVDGREPHQQSYTLRNLKKPGLSHIAATILNLLGYEAPPTFDPSLIEAKEIS